MGTFSTHWGILRHQQYVEAQKLVSVEQGIRSIRNFLLPTVCFISYTVKCHKSNGTKLYNRQFGYVQYVHVSRKCIIFLGQLWKDWNAHFWTLTHLGWYKTTLKNIYRWERLVHVNYLWKVKIEYRVYVKSTGPLKWIECWYSQWQSQIQTHSPSSGCRVHHLVSARPWWSAWLGHLCFQCGISLVALDSGFFFHHMTMLSLG